LLVWIYLSDEVVGNGRRFFLHDLLMLLKDGVQRTRQHHAIEHATLHLLAERYPQRSFAGYSDPVGFFIVGKVDSFALRRAVGDAMLRLQAGERHLAIHANCGTVLASTTLLTAFAAIFGAAGQRQMLGRLTSMMMWIMGALVVSKPLGLRLQQYTTLADIADRWLVEVRPVALGFLSQEKATVHRVVFE
jgi:hypothetical protein